jgi:hypothetical protein
MKHNCKHPLMRMKEERMIDFCDIAPSSIAELDRRFRDAYCIHIQDKSGKGSTSETSANF